MKPKLFLRADGNSNIGLGHISRMLALADILKESFNCIFISQPLEARLKDQILGICTEYVELVGKESLTEEASIIASELLSKNDIIVLDGYFFSDDYKKILKQAGGKLVFIDDLIQENQNCDVIINHAAGVSPLDYNKYVLCRYYLGPDYALLKTPFLEAAQKQRRIASIESVFISLGGADPDNYTLDVLKKVITLSEIKHITVVVGAAYRYLNTLQDFSDSRLRIVSSLNEYEMCELMEKSELAVCSASTVAYEYSSVGGLLYVLKTADNQERLYSFLINDGLALPFDQLPFYAAVNPEKVIAKQRKNFDGKSSVRLKGIFDKLIREDSLEVRYANLDDLMKYLEWANDPEVRKFSINKNEISLEEHKTWFSKKLADSNSRLYFFSLSGKSVGQVRLDFSENGWLISFLLDKDFRGKGLGELILVKALKKIREELQAPVKLLATVQVENRSSLKIFHTLGFTKYNEETINGNIFYHFRKKI